MHTHAYTHAYAHTHSLNSLTHAACTHNYVIIHTSDHLRVHAHSRACANTYTHTLSLSHTHTHSLTHITAHDTQAIIFGTCDDPIQPGQCTTVVEKLAACLIDTHAHTHTHTHTPAHSDSC